MKIKVKDIKPNPYRNIKAYPFDKAKVDSLKRSIKEKTFWDNILVRQNGKEFELAYGHHRLEALRELGIKEIDVPVRTDAELSNTLMVQIMAEENLDWNTSPAVINQTVAAVKEFLDGELAKYETWGHADKSIRVMFASNSQFQQNKQQGVGRDTVLKFLGGNWKAWMIQEALDTLGFSKMTKEQGPVDREAVETIPTAETARHFKKAVRQHKIKPEIQRKIAKRIADEGIGKRQVQETVEEYLPPISAKREKKAPPMLDDFVEELVVKMIKLHTDLMQVKQVADSIQSKSTKESFYHHVENLKNISIQILEKKKDDRNKKKIIESTN